MVFASEVQTRKTSGCNMTFRIFIENAWD